VQVLAVLPACSVQSPPQHCESDVHESLFWMQYDDGPQWLLELQLPEQQPAEPVPPCVHGFPVARQPTSGVHVPFEPH
jgi:hypothetical protein